MEEFRTCPICFEVPEKEIYQCSAGHVICNLCIAKLSQCPQCRVQYGAIRVRSRVLETLLDTQEFECKFSDKGCRHICKRNQLSVHANICKFGLGLVSLCSLWGWKECQFRPGTCSKAEIIKHFKENHQSMYECRTGIEIFMQPTKNEVRKSTSGPLSLWALLCSLDETESSPLFMITVKINSPDRFMSFMCVQLWGSSSSEKYKAEFTLQNKSDTTSDRRKVDPFVMSWTLNAYTVKEAEHMLKTYPINVYVPVLDKDSVEDRNTNILKVNISLIK